jgi:outer membrane protein OmpA-like peptidoglycan-associated protein
LVAASDADLLRRNLEAMTSQRDALAAEIASLREQLATMKQGVSEEEFADLERRYEEAMRANGFLENRLKELEGEVSKARLFARSENELVPAAIELFRSLRKLENQPDSELTTAYSRFGTDLGANVLHTLSFATGSSELTPVDQDTLRNLVADIPDGDLAFIVGYASETGNVDANQTLSSDRATTAAEFFSTMKRPGQQVQAVYLGQTDRFSSRIPERNQIVEVWRIRAKP